MKTDEEIQEDVKSELKWAARLGGAEIVVEVENGHVTLHGKVNSYPKKLEAERAVSSISGVKGVTNHLDVELRKDDVSGDEQLEEAINQAIRWSTDIDKHKLDIEVRDGWVTLSGKVDWEYQRAKARQIAEEMKGVRGVANLITVGSGLTTPENIKEKIQAALKRNYYLGSNSINVTVRDQKAVLKGRVRTLAEKARAESAAWSAPGITEVENQLEVMHPEVFV